MCLCKIEFYIVNVWTDKDDKDKDDKDDVLCNPRGRQFIVW